MYLACKLATAKAKSADVVTNKPIAGTNGALSHNIYEPGGCIATDQFIVKTPGRIQKGYGREAAKNCFHRETIYQDTASNLVRVQPQVLLESGETVIEKSCLEDWIWDLSGAMAKRYRYENGVFISDHFHYDCQGKKQT